jgi:hypothetical protein
MQFSDNRFDDDEPERISLCNDDLAIMMQWYKQLTTVGCCSGCGAYFKLIDCLGQKVCPGQGNVNRDHCDRSIENPLWFNEWSIPNNVARVMKKENMWPCHLLHLISESRNIIIERIDFKVL